MAIEDSAMASWSQARSADLPFLRDLIQGVNALDSVAAGLEAAALTAQKLADILEIVEGVLAADPIEGILGVIGEAYFDLLGDLQQTDVYALPLLPKRLSDLLHPYTVGDAIDDVLQAVADTKDPSRPIFSPGAPFATLTILVGADNWMDFRELVRLFSEMFSADEQNRWKRLADLRLQIDKFHRRPVPRAERGSQGTPWDWHQTNWLDLVPALGEGLRRLQDFADGLLGYPMGVGHALNDLLDVVLERVDYIRRVITEVGLLLDFLSKLDQLLPNLAVLGAYSAQGGTTEYERLLTSAGNQPKYKLVAGVTLLFATGSPLAQYEIVKRLLGFQVAGLENAGRQIQARAAQP